MAEQLRSLPLWNALSVMVPSESQTWLLRACLGNGEEVARSWKVWTLQVKSPLDGLHSSMHGSRWVLPELYSALRPWSASIDGRVMSFLRAAHVTEEIRATAYRRVLGDSLSALGAVGVVPVVMNGAALQETVYSTERIRHGHGIDLLIEQSQAPSAMDALQKTELLSPARPWMEEDSTVRLEHPSGACVNLWRSLFAMPSLSPSSANIRERSIIRGIAGHRIPTLSPADALLSVLGRASDSASRETLLWVCDAHHIIRTCSDLRWSTFGDAVVSCRKSIPILVLLAYLNEAFGLDVPDDVFGRLSQSAADLSRLERDLVLHAARQGANGGLRKLVRRSRPSKEQRIVLCSLLCPSWSFARRVDGAASPVRIALRYVTGPLLAAVRCFLKGRVWSGSRVRDETRGDDP